MCESDFYDDLKDLDERILEGFVGMDTATQTFAVALLREGIAQATKPSPFKAPTWPE